MARRATAEEIGLILREQYAELWKICGAQAQLSMPVDNKGARVLARVPYNPEKAEISLLIKLNDEQIEVPVEFSMDYERFRVLGGNRSYECAAPMRHPG